MMRNVLPKLLTAFALLTLFVPGGAGAAENDVNGPRCADVVNGGANYSADRTLRVFAELAGAPCQSFTYTLTVFDTPGDATPIATATGVESTFAANRVEFTLAGVDDDDTVCTVVETSAGRHVFDRAPDEGCIDVTIDVPPARSYN